MCASCDELQRAPQLLGYIPKNSGTFQVNRGLQAPIDAVLLLESVSTLNAARELLELALVESLINLEQWVKMDVVHIVQNITV